MFAVRRGSARTQERILHVFPSWQLFPLICYVCSKERECQNKRKGPTCISILTVISTDLLCLQQEEGVPEQKKGSYMYFHLDSYFHWFAMFAARRGSARTKERVLHVFPSWQLFPLICYVCSKERECQNKRKGPTCISILTVISTDLLCLQQGEGVPEQKKGSYMYFHLDSYFHWFAMFAARRGSARTKERVLHVFPSWQLFPLICYVCSKERECQNKRKGPTCISILTVISTDLLCLQQGEGVPEQKKGSYMYFHHDSY